MMEKQKSSGSNTKHFSKHMHMHKVHIYTHELTLHTVSLDEYTHKHTPWKRTPRIQTLMRTNFLQQTVACSKLNMMKWIWLINRNRNSITLYVALFQSPSLFPFSLT